MSLKETLQILIKADDQASKQIKEVEKSLKNVDKMKIKNDPFSNFNKSANNVKSNIKSISSTQKQVSSQMGTMFDQLTQKQAKASNSISKYNGQLAAFGKYGARIGTSLTPQIEKTNSSFKRLGNSITQATAKLRGWASATRQAGSSLGFFKNAASMTVGLLGYDLAASIMQTTKASINARSSIRAFADRLKMSGAETSKFQKDLDNLQLTYRKIDMDVVGQQATDMAYRLGLSKNNLTELTETTAIFTDAMQRNGRSAEDSMLAMSDAMDGQFVRLKEIGISQEDLVKNGWDKDLNNKTGLLHAMNQALKEQHYDQLAKSVDNLDDAWAVLSIAGSNLLEQVLLPLVPTILKVVDKISDFVNYLTKLSPETKKNIAYFLGFVVVAKVVIFVFGKLISFGRSCYNAFSKLKDGIMKIKDALPSLNTLKDKFNSLKQTAKNVGSSIKESFGNIKQNITSGFGSAVDTAKAKITSLKTTLIDIGGKVSELGSKFLSLGQQVLMAGYNALRSAGMWVIQKVQLIATAVAEGMATAAQWALNIAMSMNPITLVVLAIVGLIAVLVILYMKFEPVRQVVNAVGRTLWWLGSTVFNGIKTAIFNFINTIIQFGVNVKAGIQRVINAFLSLPGRIWSAICNLPATIWNALVGAIDNAKKGGKKILDGIINFVKDIPKKVGEEFLKIPQRILDSIGDAIDAAKQFGKGLIDNVLGVFGIHSPGIIQNSLANEFEALGGRITDTLPAVIKDAKKFGNDVVDATTKNFDIKGPTVKAAATPTPAPTTAPKAPDIGANKVNEDIKGIQTQAKVNNDKIIKNVSNTLALIKKKLTVGFTNNGTLVANKMKFILSTLTKSTTKIVSSFETMKNGVVRSAKNMQNQTNAWVSKLKSNITSFYQNIRHPGGAGGAGGPVRSPRRTGGAGGGSGRSIFRMLRLDKNYFKGFKMKNLNLEYLINGTMKKGGAGGIFDALIPKIKGNVRKYKTGNAKVGRYKTSHLSFPVSSFEGKKPKITFEMFKALAEDIFSQISYLFYYDSQQYGSWQKAFQVGKMNCSDSSDALIALAKACGLSASKVKGHWNQYGHYWANIAGHKMDTTGWMQRRTWTPSQSHAGPAPKGLNTPQKENTNSNNPDTLTLNGSVTIVHDLRNVPAHIDEKTLAEMINSSTVDDPIWVRELVNSNRFQTEHSRAQDRINGFNNRSAGV